ncbi:MAG: hypothetical protein K8F59_03475 [Rhodobacteraceae bacterium]|nr:hypothetical protein [Paracoccaceae bacterium]MCB1369121.1 hypothetical protein [Paracoccaceae bacterium]
MTDGKQVASWRIILAFVLDLLTAFFLIGYVVAAMTGNTSDGGFSLNGGPAIIFFVLIIAYFIGMGRYGGGTIWQRILKTKRR